MSNQPNLDDPNEVRRRWEALRAAKQTKAIGGRLADPSLIPGEMDAVLAPVDCARTRNRIDAPPPAPHRTEKLMELSRCEQKLLDAAKALAARGEPVRGVLASREAGYSQFTGDVWTKWKRLVESGRVKEDAKPVRAFDKPPRKPKPSTNGHHAKPTTPRPALAEAIEAIEIEAPVRDRLAQRLTAMSIIVEALRRLEPDDRAKVISCLAD